MCVYMYMYIFIAYAHRFNPYDLGHCAVARRGRQASLGFRPDRFIHPHTYIYIYST